MKCLLLTYFYRTRQYQYESSASKTYRLLSQGTPSSATLEFKDFQRPFSRTFLRQPCTFQKIFQIQYTASLHAVIFTLQQNHYQYLNRVAEYSIQSNS